MGAGLWGQGLDLREEDWNSLGGLDLELGLWLDLELGDWTCGDWVWERRTGSGKERLVLGGSKTRKEGLVLKRSICENEGLVQKRTRSGNEGLVSGRKDWL